MFFLKDEPINGDVSGKIPFFTTVEEPEDNFVTIKPEKFVKGRYFLMTRISELSIYALEATEIEIYTIL